MGRQGKGILIENCHNGPRQGSPAANSPFGPHVPTKDWCPFHMYRSSTDIAPVFGSILANLETIPPLAAANLSTPGCWACARARRVALRPDRGTLTPARPPPPSLRTSQIRICSRSA